MSEELPPPLTPRECDLRDFAFMPLDVVRLRDSDIAAISKAEVFRAAVLSWCAAWHQLPAASLPDDDAMISRLIGMGRDVKGWKKLRQAGALHGFVKCSDGRLYHRVVAEEARTSWEAKKAQRDRTQKARMARLSQRALDSEDDFAADNPAHAATSVTNPSKGKSRDTDSKGGEKKDSAPREKLFAPPDWIPSEPWAGFVEMRKKIRAPLTERALVLAVGELERLRRAGEDPAAVLNQSVFRGWKGLFPVKPDEANHGANGTRKSTGGINAHLQGLADLVDEADGRQEDVLRPGKIARAIAGSG